MKKILFPTDFSETANNAFVYALEMAKCIDAEVVVLHVYDLPSVSYGEIPFVVSEIYDSIELNNFENFKDQIPFLREIADKHQLGSVKMSHVLRHGDLIRTMKEICHDELIDMIVMGTNGATGLQEMFLGSNTGNAIVNIPVTLLSVPNGAKYTRLQHFGFTTKFDDADREALKKVVNIAKKFHADVKCLTVKTHGFDVSDEGMTFWKSDFKDEPVEFFLVPHDDVKETIYDFVEHQNIDVLAMVTHKRNFFEELFTHSLTQKLSYHSEKPILAFH
ncbi:universal stress protein [Flavobacterium sp.]|uniref:universal stress protein n=1 Tax=Flavobacterium sp. TaxID=239 RepID=UPI0028BD67CA|nr:universal stress protein [Flavobacterium sp.]